MDGGAIVDDRRRAQWLMVAPMPESLPRFRENKEANNFFKGCLQMIFKIFLDIYRPYKTVSF